MSIEGFNRIDRLVAASLHRMNSPEMRPLLDHLSGMLKDTDHALRRAEGCKISQLQGRAGLLEELLEAVEKSAATLEKLNKQ